MEIVLPAELFATQGTVCSLGPCESVIWLPSYFFAEKRLVSQCAGGSRPMLVCHVVCKSHLGLVALITLSEEEGFALPGHLHLSTKHLAWALKLQNNFSSS